MLLRNILTCLRMSYLLIGSIVALLDVIGIFLGAIAIARISL